jgi:hypothetical protein
MVRLPDPGANPWGYLADPVWLTLWECPVFLWECQLFLWECRLFLWEPLQRRRGLATALPAAAGSPMNRLPQGAWQDQLPQGGVAARRAPYALA